MKVVFTKLFTLLLGLVLTAQLSAQINAGSPYPVTVEILSPPEIAGSYDYGTQTEEWGPQLAETISGEIQWGYTADGDSLGCSPIVTDLTGKMALIRRGVCNFSLKAYHAQEAGAIGAIICNHYDNADDTPDTLVGMLGGDSLDAVVIPAIFLSRASCEAITTYLDAGTPVEISFTIRTMQDQTTAYSYHTPQSQIIEMDAISVNVYNISGAETDVTVTATITDPNGLETALAVTATMADQQDSTIFFEPYLPADVGTYNVVYTNSISEDTVTASFAITEYTWGTDSGMGLRGIAPSADQFIEGGLIYHTGSLYLPNDQGTVVTHATFGLGNPAELFTGDPAGDVFTFILYDGDADDNGAIDLQNSFDDLTPIATGAYVLTGEEGANELLDVELESFTGEPIQLDPNGFYYITVLYNGINSGLGIPPAITGSNDVNYFAISASAAPTTPLFLDQLYSGWAGAINVVRLHTEGYIPSSSIETLLEDYKVTVMPNPATEYVNLQFNLDEMADEVLVSITNFNGQQVQSHRLNGVVDGTYNFDVRQLPAGTYFIGILTPEGYAAKKFVVVK